MGRRLQILVNNFAKKAVRGCRCTYMREAPGEREPMLYQIDKTLEYLALVKDDDPALKEITCPIAAIQDIYSFAEDGKECFPKQVVESIGPEERDLLLMVVYRGGADKMDRFCRLEESPESRDVF